MNPSILLPILLAACLHAESTTESYPDGSRSQTVTLDKQGHRQGQLTAWWPGGKITKEKSRWEQGLLHGPRQLFDEKGRLVVEETWIHGRLIYPRSQQQTADALTRIEQESAQWVAAWPKPSNPAAASPTDQAKALARLRQYRFLCGLPHDVNLDDRYTDEAQEGARILVALGKLDHFPTQPAGWGDAEYAKAKDACGHGNLAMGAGDLVRAVDMWMDDSDPSNIAVLGHRRWLMNPPMQLCGFGINGKYSVIWAHDSGRTQLPAQSWQAFPPPGFMPLTHFSNHHAWHISLNPADYTVELKTTTFQIFPIDQKMQRGPALALEHDGGDGGGYGSYGNARIILPDGKGNGRGQPPYTVAKGRSYEAVVGGLAPKGDAPKEISWVVTFY